MVVRNIKDKHGISMCKNSVVLRGVSATPTPAVLIESDNFLDALGNEELLICYLNKFSSLSLAILGAPFAY